MLGETNEELGFSSRGSSSPCSLLRSSGPRWPLRIRFGVTEKQGKLQSIELQSIYNFQILAQDKWWKDLVLGSPSPCLKPSRLPGDWSVPWPPWAHPILCLTPQLCWSLEQRARTYPVGLRSPHCYDLSDYSFPNIKYVLPECVTLLFLLPYLNARNAVIISKALEHAD